MKLVIKTIIDIPACIFLIQISALIVFGIFQATGLASNLLVAVIALMMLYCINLTLDEVKFLKMSKAKNMLSLIISIILDRFKRNIGNFSNKGRTT